MKKFKKSMIVLAICAVAITGYNAYERATMTEQERLIQANLEALTSGEDGGIIHEYCYSGDSGTSIEGYTCASGTTTTISIPTTPIGVTYPCSSNKSKFKILCKTGYCYNPE